jgi:hypothetical protein
MNLEYGVSIAESRLNTDIHSDHRDAMYRAFSFIERHGGPSLPGDTSESLMAHRKAAVDWLFAQKKVRDLVRSYDVFVENWGPVFPD